MSLQEIDVDVESQKAKVIGLKWDHYRVLVDDLRRETLEYSTAVGRGRKGD
jgi:hypothetical protein